MYESEKTVALTVSILPLRIICFAIGLVVILAICKFGAVGERPRRVVGPRTPVLAVASRGVVSGAARGMLVDGARVWARVGSRHVR